MTREEIQYLVIAAIQEVAPEVEASDINEEEDIREACDLDSMDFLNYLITLKKSTGVNILERDYVKVSSFKKMLDYLTAELD